MRSATAHLVALVEGGRPDKIAEKNWPNDRDVGLLIKGAVSPTTTTNAAALLQLTTNFVASLSGAWAAPALFAQSLQLSFDGAATISVPGFVADASKASFVGQIETTKLGHHEPSSKIRLGLRASFLGDTGVGARGHGGPMVRPPKLAGAFMAIVGQFAWVSRLTSGVPFGVGLARQDLTLPPKPPSGHWTKLKGLAGRHR